LPERIESPREQQVVDGLKEIKADYDAMRMTEAMQASRPPSPPNPTHSPSVSAGASAPIAPSASCPPSAPIARCAPCPCGSGNKYKRCCGSASAGKFTPPASPQHPTSAPGATA
jgi:uncharacterized protein YecA (UPF0149 family)